MGYRKMVTPFLVLVTEFARINANFDRTRATLIGQAVILKSCSSALPLACKNSCEFVQFGDQENNCEAISFPPYMFGDSIVTSPY